MVIKEKAMTFVRENPVTVYVILSYMISWLCWFISISLAHENNFLLPAASNYVRFLEAGFLNTQHASLSFLFIFAVYGPLIATLVVTAAERGRTGISDLVISLIKWRIAIKWYFAIAIVSLLLISITLVTGFLTGISSAGKLQFIPLSYVLLFFLLQVMTSGLGEEPGWRGFLLPRLQAKHDQGRAVVYTGLVWAAWHYPFVILFSFSVLSTEFSFSLALEIFLGLCGFTVSIIGMSFIYAWIFNASNSLFLSVIFHALSNVLPLVIIGGLDPSLNIVLAITPWLFIFFMERKYGKSWYYAINGVRAH